MILRLLQVITFIFVATIEVRVHASGAASGVVSLREDMAPLQEPAGCLEEGDTCAIKTNTGRKFQLEVGKSKVTLGSGSSAIKAGKDKITFVRGTALVKAESPLFIETEFGKVIVKQGEVILLKQESKLITRVNSGEVFIQPRGFSEMIAVEPGEENWMGTVDKSGIAQTGVSTSINFTEHALIWSSLYFGKKRSFEKELKTFAQAWRQANEKTAAAHADLAQRRIASIEADFQRRQKELQKRQAYESELRHLFRKKSLDQ